MGYKAAVICNGNTVNAADRQLAFRNARCFGTEGRASLRVRHRSCGTLSFSTRLRWRRCSRANSRKSSLGTSRGIVAWDVAALPLISWDLTLAQLWPSKECPSLKRHKLEKKWRFWLDILRNPPRPLRTSQKPTTPDTRTALNLGGVLVPSRIQGFPKARYMIVHYPESRNNVLAVRSPAEARI